MTLTRLSYLARKFLFWSIVGIITFYTLKFAFIKARDLYLSLNPPVPPPPEASFGKLPKLKFNNLQQKEDSKPEYVLDTKTGTLPSFPDRIDVYKLQMPQPEIYDEKDAKYIASSLGFTGSLNKLALNRFEWKDNTDSRNLFININTKEVKLGTDLDRLEELLTTGYVAPIEDAKTKAISLLSQRGLYTNDLQNAEVRTSYVVLNNGTLSEAASYIQANMVRVDLFKKIINSKETYYIYNEDPTKSYTVIYVVRYLDDNVQRSNLIYPIFYYNNQNTLSDAKSMYGLLPIAKVWDFIKNGGGNFVYLKKNSDDYYTKYESLDVSKMEVRSISIGYYETKEPQTFLQPIYVFSGVFTTSNNETGNFYIYHQAVDSKYLDLDLEQD